MKPTHVRWIVCALVFFATTINYVDRQVLALLNPILKKEIGWTDADFGVINGAFQFTYGIGMLLAGWWIDRVGTRRGYAIAISVWSVAALFHAAARSALAFCFARAALGIGESGNFPCAIKTIAEWFPQKQRALATGIMNSGSNIGATVAPIVVPIITTTFGWPMAFILTGLLGFAWLALWLIYYRPLAEHPAVNEAERSYVLSDVYDLSCERLSWRDLLRHKQTWTFMLLKAMTDPIWWFYLTWLPTFLNQRFHLDIKSFGPPLVVIYLFADFGSVFGGWLSSSMLRRGLSPKTSRKTAMLVCAVAVVPIVAVTQTNSLVAVVALVGLAAAAHQGWSCNLFTLASDMFPKRAVASVVGLGGFAGAMAGTIFPIFIGRLLDRTHSYFIPFAIASCAYLLALGALQLLAPGLAPVEQS